MAKSISELKDRSDVGTIIAFAGHKNPEGYLLCDGSLFLITDKFALFNAIGTNYGGSITGTPAILDTLSCTTATVVEIDSVTPLLRISLHRDAGSIGMPTLANPNGFTMTINGYVFDVETNEVETTTGSLWLYARDSNVTSESWWQNFNPGDEWSPSGGFVIVNDGTSISNTGWSGNFGVPNLQEDCVLSANAQKVTMNAGNRNVVNGSNTHDPSVSMAITGNVTLTPSGGLSIGTQNAAKPNATGVYSDTTITQAMIPRHKHHVLIGYRAESRRYLQGNGGTRSLTHTAARRSGNQANDTFIATSSTGSNTNNKHSHPLTVTTGGNIQPNVSSNTLTGNLVSQVTGNAIPSTVSVKNPTLTVKYLIKEI